jgi:hypothetical protein
MLEILLLAMAWDRHKYEVYIGGIVDHQCLNFLLIMILQEMEIAD